MTPKNQPASSKPGDEPDARAQREAEKRAWIATRGSDALKRRVAAGYNAQRRYVDERVRIELPGFLVDVGHVAKYRSRNDPSDDAFEEAEALKADGWDASVVWLTVLPGGVEAVIVEGYLGQYTAFKLYPDRERE